MKGETWAVRLWQNLERFLDQLSGKHKYGDRTSHFICGNLCVAAGMQVCLGFLQWKPSYAFSSWLVTEILSISFKACILKTSGQKRCTSSKSLGSLECFAISLQQHIPWSFSFFRPVSSRISLLVLVMWNSCSTMLNLFR